MYDETTWSLPNKVTSFFVDINGGNCYKIKDYISRGHSFDMPIFYEGLK